MKRISEMSLRGKILGLVIAAMTAITVSSFISLELMSRAYKQTLSDEIRDKAIFIGDRVAAQFFERYGMSRLSRSIQSLRIWTRRICPLCSTTMSSSTAFMI